jgi:hypothetical protein
MHEELYRKLYSKYVPDLTGDELEKKLQHALTLDSDKFIDAFYKKYTGAPPTEKQSKYINSVIDDKFPEFRKDLIYIKPKNAKEAIYSVSNIREGINENTPAVIDAIAKKYFKLPKKTATVQTMGLSTRGVPTTQHISREPTDEEIKSHFEGIDASGKRTGDFSKYEQYLEYQKTKVFNLDWVDESTKLNAVEYHQRQRTEQYIANIDNDEVRESAEIAEREGVYDIYEPDEGHWLHRHVQAEKEDRKANEEYKKTDALGFTRGTKGESKVSAVLVEYLKDKQKHLSRDSFNWENDYKRFEETQNKYQGEIDKLKEELDALGDVNEYSSPKNIAKYNKIAAKQNSIIEKFNQETEGLNIMERHADLMARVEKHEKAWSKITDADAIAKAFALNYNIGERLLLHMEKSIVGSIGGMGWGALKLISDIGEGIYSRRAKGTMKEAYGELTVQEQDRQTFDRLHRDDNLAVADYFQNTYAAHIDYQESLDNHMQSTLPLNIPWKDVGLHNIGEVSGQLVANNSFSILSALTYGGAIRAGINVPLATGMLTGTFFLVEGGAKLSQMEIAQKNAAENIAILEKALPFAITQDERLEILEQISAQDKALNVTQVQKAFSTILYGGIAAYAERLGTLGYVRRLNTMIRAASRPSIMNAIKGAGVFTLNSGIEYVEEFVTQVGHNLTDIAILKQNKSLIAGIDAEFNMNVLFSTFAIQAPSTGRNIYNSVRNEVSSRKDIAKDRQRRNEILEYQILLKRDDEQKLMTPAQRDSIKAKITDLFKEAGIVDSYIFGNAAQLTRTEIDALFDAQAKKRDKLAEMRDIGASAVGETEESSYIKRQRKILTGDINQLDNEINEILLKPEQRNRKTVEEVLGKENVQAETEFYFGKYQAAKQIGKGLGNQQVFKDDIVDGKRVEGSGIANLETFLNEQLKKRNITLQFKNDALAGAKRGNYALHVGNTVVLMEDNIINDINNAPSSLAKSIVAYAPFHELQHINDIATGLVKDGDVIETQKTVVAGIQDHIENLYKRGKIKDKDYNFIKGRIDQYTKNNGGNVNLKELLTIAGELKDAGILSQESRDPLLSMKILLNKFIRRNFGDREMFFKLKDTDQVLQYIDSFQRGVRGSRLMLGPKEKVEKVNFSEIYQQVEAMYNEEAWADPKKRSDLALQMAYTLIPEVTRRMQNVNLDETTKEDIAIDFAVHEKRGLFGLIKKYDKEVNDSVMGYLNSFVKGKLKLFDLRLQEFYQADPRYGEVIQSMEQEGVGAQVAKLTDETNLENALEDDTKKPKTDVLKVGKVAAKEQDIIQAVNEKGDFRNVIDNNVGTVGNIIFNIPAKKIADPTANITTSDKIIDPKTGKPVKKGERGILEPSEAKSIQDHFADINTAKKFIQVLNDTNVTEKDADVNKVGENIEVSRDVYGRAIGLPRRVLDYFYRPKFKSDGKRVRSQGKTSQVPVWELKPEFRGLNDEQLTKAAEQFQKDLGITGKQQVNKLPTKADRSKIGQLLKGAAVVVSQQASLSAAQRKLEKAKAPKKQIADVTTAQSKTAFSEVISSVDQEHTGAIDTTFEGDFNRINKLLVELIGEGLFKHSDQTEIDIFFESFENIILAKLPQNMVGGALASFLKPSRRILPNSGKETIKLTDGREITLNDYYTEKRNNLVKRVKEGKVKFGTKFKGRGAEYVYGKTYLQMFGKGLKANDPKLSKAIEKSFYDGTREKYNAIHDSMHRQFMERVNESIRSNRNNAKVWGNYFSLVGLDTEHPFRMGAEWILFSENPIGAKYAKGSIRTNRKEEGFKYYEWEHAMMATRAYLYLLKTSLEKVQGKYFDFDLAYSMVMENFKLIALDNYDDKKKLGDSGRQKTMGKIGASKTDWKFFENKWQDRYWDIPVAEIKGINGYGINPNSLLGKDRKTAAEIYNINIEGNPRPLKTDISKNKTLNEATQKARNSSFSEAIQGITVLDFDDTLATTESLVRYTAPDGTTGALNAEQYASQYQDLLAQGYKFDFTEFDKVVKAKLAPLFNKALKLQKKFGPENMFILTARPIAAQKAIFDFLKANGLNIPLKNISTLGNSTAEAKALWVAEKVGEGYNDFYFADDALKNVQAVKNMLDQFDVKSKVQQAKINFSEALNDNFNTILEDITGIDAKKRFSTVKARKRGDKKGKWRLFIPPSHEDFAGLLYNFMGKGKKGDAHRKFFEKALIRPLNRAFRELDTAKQSIANDYKSLNKEFKNVKKKLTKKTPDGDFTYSDAIRVYLWNKHGYKIPGLSETDQQKLVDLVTADQELQVYAETLNVISKREDYVKPTNGWESGDIRMDLDDATGRVGRSDYFTEFNENADIIFSEENLNKIEATFGKDFREALEDMLYRIQTGKNRPKGNNSAVNIFVNYLNGSVGVVMFLNMRSAVLQQLSIVNYINFADNNIFAAGKAFANLPQYCKDFAMIFNSDMLKQRRGGIRTDVNAADLVDTLKGSRFPGRVLIAKLLQLGFTPTQIGDSFAIAAGGATFYRNRIKTYLKDGLSQKEAEAKAWTDFQDLTQSTQQSARPDMVSQQQASPIGKFILNFQNITSQYNRFGKKAFLDIYNKRITPPNKTLLQSNISNASRILYYFAIQNLIFYSLQTALFAAMFDDDEEDKKFFTKKRERLINGSIDSVLRGAGWQGAVIATLKNMAIKFAEQRRVGYNPDESSVLMEMLNVSPVIGIKGREISNAEKTLNYNKKVIKEMETFDIDNPMWSAVTNYIEGTTNIPVNRLYKKTQNVRQSLNSEHEAWQRILMFLGWSQYNLGIKNPEVEKVKEKLKKPKKKKKKERITIYR